jgi:hypothetical protein
MEAHFGGCELWPEYLCIKQVHLSTSRQCYDTGKPLTADIWLWSPYNPWQYFVFGLFLSFHRICILTFIFRATLKMENRGEAWGPSKENYIISEIAAHQEKNIYSFGLKNVTHFFFVTRLLLCLLKFCFWRSFNRSFTESGWSWFYLRNPCN